MSTTRSTMSQVTSIHNRVDSLNKENALFLPKLTESKIIFVNNYNKNRNLSKSLAIKLPYIQEKQATNFPIFQEDLETEKNIKPILKNSLKNRLKLDLAIGRESLKSVRFIDEVEEDDAYAENTTNYFNVNEKAEKALKIKEDSKENINLNLNLNGKLSEILKKQKQLNEESEEENEEKKGEILVDNKYNKKGKDKEKQNSDGSKSIKSGAEKELGKIQFKKSLVEIITVPSYRNYNIYRTSSKDFIKKNIKQEEPNAKCKCCTIF